ncbi:addiction module protein [Candidatus Ruthia endofausta]|uniref:Addiction module protein n=1 Tax=Candidatus Ruthia endofausta TaxID=2738852 RepID=A0A6N0HN76_9GAMM|nr:addiction module protein [Candidatus Ruthia endofausta]QKQ23741.1 addiction module protein [Candidatus Ruthia endofausta]
MSVVFKQVIENIGALSSSEKALMAHCLISSLESEQDKNVDEIWVKLAEKRYLDLTSRVAKGVSWGEIKNTVKFKSGQSESVFTVENNIVSKVKTDGNKAYLSVQNTVDDASAIEISYTKT